MSSSSTGTTYRHTWFHYVAACLFVALSGIAVREMRFNSPVPDFPVLMEKTVASRNCDGLLVLAEYTGFAPVDILLHYLVTAFLPGAAGLDKGFQVLLVYFLISFFPVVTIWCVESGRINNRSSLIAYPALYSLFYQTVGGAIIIPLYYVAYIYTTRRPDYFSTGSSAMSTSFARALTPSVLVGYLLPTLLVSFPVWDLFTLQKLIALWQPSPLFVSLLLYVFTWLFSRSKGGETKHLKNVYATCFIVSSACHIGMVVYILISEDPQVSFSEVFDVRITGSRLPAGLAFSTGIKYAFQIDFWIIFASSVLWAYLAIYDLNQAGKSNVGMVEAFVYLTAGSVLLGPATVLSATWNWREQKLTVAETKTATKGKTKAS